MKVAARLVPIGGIGEKIEGLRPPQEEAKANFHLALESGEARAGSSIKAF